MKIWLSCEVRAARHDDYWGYGLLVEWPSKKLLDLHTAESNIPGAHQGIRRMFRRNGVMYILWNNRIEVRNVLDMELMGTITSPWLFGPHAILFDNPNNCFFWVDCNMRDSLIRIDWKGNVLEEIRLDSTHAPLDEDFKTVPDAQIEEWRTEGKVDRLHLNTIQMREGELYAGGAACRALFQVKPRIKVIIHWKKLSSPHDFHIMPHNRLVVGDSGRGSFLIFDRANPDSMRYVMVNGFAGVACNNAAVGWTRGLLQIDEERVLVGSSPLSVYQVNVATGRIEDWAVFAGNASHACHGIDIYEE